MARQQPIKHTQEFDEPSVWQPRKLGAKWAVLMIIFIAVLILGIATFLIGARLDSGMTRIRDEIIEMRQYASDVRTYVENNEFQKALTAVNDLALSTDIMTSETNSWVWGIAKMVPIYGQDVQTAVNLINIADNIADSVAVPIITQWADLMDSGMMGGSREISSEELAHDIELVQQLIDTLAEAEATTKATCAEVETMHATRVTELEAGIYEARAGLKELDQALTTVNNSINAAMSLKDSILEAAPSEVVDFIHGVIDDILISVEEEATAEAEVEPVLAPSEQPSKKTESISQADFSGEATVQQNTEKKSFFDTAWEHIQNIFG
ncbi:MAG: hypothetical protein IKE43_03520 [Coriobacteriales bacterium]|nr:hypothetical protein [Coriobacteriales bacterium]